MTLSGRLWPNGEVWAGHLARPSGMGLVNLRKNHKPIRGSHGITAHGRRIVRQAAFIAERDIGRADLSFLTCTLPGVTMGECRRANAAWPEICRRFLQELRRELERKGAPGWFVGCTEIQPKRYEATGQPWPHLHLIFCGRTGKPWLIGPQRATALWGRVVTAVLGIPTEDLQWATTIKPLTGKKSAGHYLAKYMSKGSEQIEELRNSDESFPLPRAWHHCSHDLSRMVAAGMAKLTPKTSAWVIKLLQEKHPGSKLFREICPTPTISAPNDAPIGYVGMLDPPLAMRVRRFNSGQRRFIVDTP